MESEDYFCIFCSDKYVDPSEEDWIMCYVCKKMGSREMY